MIAEFCFSVQLSSCYAIRTLTGAFLMIYLTRSSKYVAARSGALKRCFCYTPLRPNCRNEVAQRARIRLAHGPLP